MSQPDGMGMNGLEIASTISNVLSAFAPILLRALDAGLSHDPVLERQLRSAMEVANQMLLDADKRFVAMDLATDDRIKP